MQTTLGNKFEENFQSSDVRLTGSAIASLSFLLSGLPLKRSKRKHTEIRDADKTGRHALLPACTAAYSLELLVCPLCLSEQGIKGG